MYSFSFLAIDRVWLNLCEWALSGNEQLPLIKTFVREFIQRRTQEGGGNLLAQLEDCAADDLSHYDVTSELVREISMAAKR